MPPSSRRTDRRGVAGTRTPLPVFYGTVVPQSCQRAHRIRFLR
jgi:hypothetical protein